MLLGIAQVSATVKIAVVNMEKIYNDYYKTQAKMSQFEKQKEVYKNYSISLRDELDKLKKKYENTIKESQNITLKDDIRKKKQDEAANLRDILGVKEKELIEYNRSKLRELTEKSRTVRETLIKEIKKTVKEVGILEGYHLVMDSSAKNINNIETIIYSSPYIDITDNVLKKLNAK
jgi:outer membrane protein